MNMLPDRQHILAEIKRTAQDNGGVPLGTARFLQVTGIKPTDWEGKLWVRWGDALSDAGFAPNQFGAAYDKEFVMEKLISLVRELRAFPLTRQLKLKNQADKSFPSRNVFHRLGSKQELAAMLIDYCKTRTGYDDVIALCEPVAAATNEGDEADSGDGPLADPSVGTKQGYVYLALLKLGREKRYKIGKAVLVDRRTDQISLQLPEDLELVHTITTDDAYGIEDYWHRRFAAKNTKGEWFSLSRENIDAFRRRKFM